jgi:hypothetical protein
MFEINPKIADADSLFQRVVNTAKSRQIADEFYDGELKSPYISNYCEIRDIMQNVYDNLQVMNTTWPICEKPLRSNHRVIGGAIVFCKRVVRKLTRWLYQPYFQQQTDFNSAVTKTVSDMIKVQEMLITFSERDSKEG